MASSPSDITPSPQHCDIKLGRLLKDNWTNRPHGEHPCRLGSLTRQISSSDPAILGPVGSASRSGKKRSIDDSCGIKKAPWAFF